MSAGTVESGSNVKVHYKGTLEDGTEFDNSRTRGETLGFEVGNGQMIQGFNTAVVGMTVGEIKSVVIPHAEAYGDHDPEAITLVEKTQFPQDFDFKIGATVYGQSDNGQQIMAKILEDNGDKVTMDFNHPLAGQDLSFEIELVEIN